MKLAPTARLCGITLMIAAPIVASTLLIMENSSNAWGIFLVFLISGSLLIIIDRVNGFKISKDAIEIEAIKEKAIDYSNEIEKAYEKIQCIESEIMQAKLKSNEAYNSLEKLQLKHEPILNEGFKIDAHYYGWVIIIKSPSDSFTTNMKTSIFFNEDITFINHVGWGEYILDDPIKSLKDYLPELIEANHAYYRENKIRHLDHIYPRQPGEKRILVFISNNKISKPTIIPTLP